MNDEYSKNGILQKRIVNAEELDKNCCENYRETSGSNCDNDEKHEKTDSSNCKHSIKLLSVCDVPHYLAFNQNIRKGYRSALSLQQCIARLVNLHCLYFQLIIILGCFVDLKSFLEIKLKLFKTVAKV